MSLSLSPAMLCKCLSDETRLQATLLVARFGELCVCDLVAALDAPQSTVSRHLAQLRSCGLLSGRRAGQWVHYRLNPELPEWAGRVIGELCAAATLAHPDLIRRAQGCCPPPVALS
ncbi:metalloregulator ArsR/SmtB family transcription factor [Alcanivorax sp. JB21]|uniref:metalloregulator ArsR/SmtB family transcription factor n=1 Tax=Alcanivorax limicola TaxID=2874102 RepID=UPI001CBF3675|nr:metalloregulator ArsR/SmtB family transcription factor [Alcanivorax limicola]MBZ2188789.1 metalloregulator ArsR/SmtB family transcription factor [Alcanivorax limicola]